MCELMSFPHSSRMRDTKLRNIKMNKETDKLGTSRSQASELKAE